MASGMRRRKSERKTGKCNSFPSSNQVSLEAVGKKEKGRMCPIDISPSIIETFENFYLDWCSTHSLNSTQALFAQTTPPNLEASPPSLRRVF